MEENQEPVIVCGFDPGKTTGYAVLSLKDQVMTPLDWGESTDESLQDLVPHIQRSSIVVIEGFWVNPGKARRGNFDYDKMIAPQVIGALQMKGRELGKVVHIQPSAIKPVGYGYAAMKYVKGKKGMHKEDALCHAVYYCVKTLHAMPLKRP